MIAPAIPINEDLRLEALRSLNILDTEPEKEYDDITALAAHLCDTKTALISLADSNRQWFKSKYGMHSCEMPRENSYCAHTILYPKEIQVVPDARKDERFAGNPLTEGEHPVIFYAGVPLIDKDGFALGTLCVIDSIPKELTPVQINSLKALANHVMLLFELNKKNRDLEFMQNELKKQNESLSEFAGIISHDMKMPLANMIMTTDVLKASYQDIIDEDGKKYLDYLKQSSFTLSDYIDNLLAHYESDKLVASASAEKFDINHLLEEIIDLLNLNEEITFNFPEDNMDLNCNRAALEQILLNLIGNSLKYNDKKHIVIDVECCQDTNNYYFKISDNGIGIPLDRQQTIFDLFTTVSNTDRNGKKGNGIGLSTVKKLIDSLGGVITVSSEVDQGTSFNFSIKK